MNVTLEPFQVFILFVLAIMAIRFMWQDVFEYLAKRNAHKSVHEIMSSLGKEIDNGRNDSRRKKSSED